MAQPEMDFHLPPPPVHGMETPEAAVDGHFAGRLSDDLRWELNGWVILPIVALAIAGLMAILVALLRVPGVDNILPWSSQTFFEKGLIAHVTFAFVIWYLGVQGAMTVLASAAAGSLPRGYSFIGRVGFYAAGLSFVLILIPVLFNLGEPSANNYVPVLIHPLFFAGLTLLAFGLALPVLRLIVQVAGQRTCEPTVFAIAASGVIFLLALICIGAAWITMPAGMPAVDAAERAFWGLGHIMQFAHTLLLLAGFFLLSRMSLGETPLTNGWFKIMAGFMVAGAAIGPLLYISYAANDPAQVTAFTDLYWYVLPWPVAAVMLATGWLFFQRARPVRDQTPEVTGLWVAFILFSVGGLIGFFESSVDTRTPAHYHAELIGVTIVFMCLYFALFVPLLDRPMPTRRTRTLSYVLLGTGQMFHSMGLFAAGLDGVARKVAASEQGLDSATKIASMALMGLGGLIAVFGGVTFVVIAGRSILLNKGPLVSDADELDPHSAADPV